MHVVRERQGGLTVWDKDVVMVGRVHVGRVHVGRVHVGRVCQKGKIYLLASPTRNLIPW